MFRLVPIIPVVVAGAIVIAASLNGQPPAKSRRGELQTAIASWGSDHVGKRLPEFMSGDECLFCHRKKVGPQWSSNRHQLSLRSLDKRSPAARQLTAGFPQTAAQAEFVMGRRHQRYLRRAKQYGKLDLLSTQWHAAKGKAGTLRPAGRPSWDGKRFAERCAGCHASGVESKTQAFTAISHDCFVCHGDVQLNHTRDSSKVVLSRKSETRPRVVASVCGQCHLRGGKSKSSGRPYPNQFVAGDNLFRDFQYDFSDARLSRLHPTDRHIAHNIRDMAQGVGKTTCLDCHNVHANSADKHQSVPASKLCWTCHDPDKPRSHVKRRVRRSSTCEY